MNQPRGARPLSDVAGKLLRDSFARQGFASTELVARWPEIAGAEIAAHAEPERIKWPRRQDDESEPATLLLRVQGPAAIEIQHMAPVIIERVNRFFGWRAIGRVTLRQAPIRRRIRPLRRRLDPRAVDDEAAALPDITDDGLRAALARLGASIKSR